MANDTPLTRVSEEKRKMARASDGLILSVLTGLFFANPVLAQTTVWGIDSMHSAARLFVSSSNRRDTRINVGVAILSGEIRQNTGDSLPAAFAFQIYPADKNPKLVQPEGRGTEPHGLNSTGSTIFTFSSRAVEPVDEKTVRVRGDLTATYVSRDATYDPSKGYSGPVFGPPITHTMKREAIFVFRRVVHAGAREEERRNAEWSASSTIPSDAFPELWNAVVTTDWPAFVLGEQCVMPSSVGGALTGPACEGRVVEPAPRTDIHCVMPSAVGEDFAGEVCTGAPLPVVPKRENESRAGGGHGNKSSPQLLANELEIELHVSLAEAHSAPPKSPTRPGHSFPLTSARRNEPEILTGLLWYSQLTSKSRMVGEPGASWAFSFEFRESKKKGCPTVLKRPGQVRQD